MTELAQQVHATLARSHGLLARAVERALAPHGLTRPQYELLCLLADGEALPLHDLARRLGVAAGNVTVIAENLERHGWLVRTTLETDRRVRLARLTPAGSSLITEVQPAIAEAVTAQLAGLTDDEQEILMRLLRKLATSLKA